MDSSSTYQELAAALRERLTVIADRDLYQRDPQAHLEKLKSVSERINAAGKALPKPIPGDLAHYLHGSSYHKALAWLEGHGYA